MPADATSRRQAKMIKNVKFVELKGASHGLTWTAESVGIKIRAYCRGNSADLAETAQQRHGLCERQAQPIAFLHMGETDCVAEDAVLIGPVSAPRFPANREINREFCRFHPSGVIFASIRLINSMACSEIPYATEQGILAR